MSGYSTRNWRTKHNSVITQAPRDVNRPSKSVENATPRNARLSRDKTYATSKSDFRIFKLCHHVMVSRYAQKSVAIWTDHPSPIRRETARNAASSKVIWDVSRLITMSWFRVTLPMAQRLDKDAGSLRDRTPLNAPISRDKTCTRSKLDFGLFKFNHHVIVWCHAPKCTRLWTALPSLLELEQQEMTRRRAKNCNNVRKIFQDFSKRIVTSWSDVTPQNESRYGHTFRAFLRRNTR